MIELRYKSKPSSLELSLILPSIVHLVELMASRQVELHTFHDWGLYYFERENLDVGAFMVVNTFQSFRENNKLLTKKEMSIDEITKEL